MTKETILVINDEPLVREMIALFLQEQQFKVIEAGSGKEGLQKALEKPDLILLDVVMPEMDGYQVCKELKSIKEVQDIPVIFISSLSDPKDKIKGLEVGGVDFVTRAQDRGEIMARVNTHLKIKALNQELKNKNELLEAKQKYLDDDLNAAAIIQRTLLPQNNPFLKDLHFSWVCEPCDLIGGDIFNYIPLTENLTAFYILDVSGHGVPSAMVTVFVTEQLQTLKDNYLHTSSDKILSPREVAHHLNEHFPLERFDKFFSFFFGILNLEKKTLTYTNAGHPPPLLLKRGGAIGSLDTTNTVIGAEDLLNFKEETKAISQADKLILFTDGVIELSNEKDEFFGTDRMVDFMKQNQDQPIDLIVSRLLKTLTDFRGKKRPLDDLSIFGIEISSLS
jgi:sigma-B regulation protein RsbU (phosphoserine phosphatase)